MYFILTFSFNRTALNVNWALALVFPAKGQSITSL